MSEDALAFVLRSDHLNMDEADILEKVTEWATVNSVVTGVPLKDVAKNVISNVRFGLLDTEKLSQVEKENVKKDYIPVSGKLLNLIYPIIIDNIIEVPSFLYLAQDSLRSPKLSLISSQVSHFILPTPLSPPPTGGPHI